jgi:hypothetical protein
MNYIRARTVKAHKKHAHQFDYFANHKIKDYKQKSLNFFFYPAKNENVSTNTTSQEKSM